MDAMAQSWVGLHLYMCPPVPLAAKAILKLVSSEGASAVLVVPKWPLASFWPTLLPDGSHFANRVENWIEFFPKYYSGPAVKSKMFRGVKKWATLAVYLSAGIPAPLEPCYRPSHCLKNGCNFCATME